MVPHSGSGLLLSLIVRACGGLVEARSRFAATENRSACPAKRSGGPHPGHPRPVASVSQREGFLALRSGAPALLLPEPLFPEPAQSAHPSPGAGDAPLAACLLRRARLPFGRLSRDGHDARAAIVRVRASRKGLFAGQATFGRSASKTEWVYGFKAALVVDPQGVVSAFGLAPAASEERHIGEALVSSDHHGAYLADKGFAGVGTALDGA